MCESGENFGTCSVDCDPENINIQVVSPTFTEIAYGETLLLKVRLNSNEKGINGARVTAKGFFGSIELENNGTSEDEKAGDDVYAQRILVPLSLKEEKHEIELKVVFRELEVTQTIELTLNPKITLETSYPKEFFLTEKVEVSGNMFIKEFPTSGSVDLKIASETGKELFTKSLVSSELGFFSAVFQTSTIDPPGKWTLVIEAVDMYNNKASETYEILARQFQEKPSLDINFTEEPKAAYSMLEKMKVSVSVIDRNGQEVQNAEVSLALPGAGEIRFVETSPARYEAEFVVPRQIGAGVKEFEITARSVVEDIQVKSSKKFSAEILSASLAIEVTKPTTLEYALGSTLEIEVKVLDALGNPVNDAKATALIGEIVVTLELKKPGVYGTTINVDEKFGQNQEIRFKAVDDYDNNAESRLQITVSGSTALYDLEKNIVTIIITLAVIIIGGGFEIATLSKKKTLSGLLEKKAILEGTIKKTQELYFHERTMAPEEYRTAIEKYQNELGIVEKKLESLKNKN